MIWPFSSPTVDDLTKEMLTAAHSDAVSKIHQKTFKHYWSDGEFQSLLSNEHTSGIVLRLPHDKGGEVVGFVLVRTVIDEAEILTIAVDPKWQQHGVGRALMNIIINDLRAQEVGSLFLEVAQSNKNALKLYLALGFEQVSIRENYYKSDSGGQSNALVMRRDVG